MENAFARPVANVLARFGVDEHNGLTDKQVEELRRKHGRNGASLLIWSTPLTCQLDLVFPLRGGRRKRSLPCLPRQVLTNGDCKAGGEKADDLLKN